MPATRLDPAKHALDPPLNELYRTSRAAEFDLSSERFLAILEEIAVKHASSVAMPAFCETLRIDDLVLARACAAGNDRAWEVFLTRFREKLYDVARQITREDSAARELADTVYADLFGTKTRDGKRVSKLDSYTGRGSLEGWLRTVLAQEFVNIYRRQRRLVSLDEESEDGVQFAAALPNSDASPGPGLESATDQALRALSPEERFVLVSYFLDGRTLAEVARALSVHESTISRKVEKLTKQLRKAILKNLSRQGMSRRQAEEALSVDVRDLALNLRASLAQESVARTFTEKGAKTGERGS